MKKLVEDRVKSGVDWIKVFGSRGSFEMRRRHADRDLRRDEGRSSTRRMRSARRWRSIRTAPSGVKDAVRAGADSVEHGADVDDETLAEMVKRGTVWVPTVDHNRYYIDAQAEYGFAPDRTSRSRTTSNATSSRCGERRQGRREDRDGIRRGLLDVRPEHARARLAGQGRHDQRPGAGRGDDDAGGAAGDAGQARPGRARLPGRPGGGRRRSARRASTPCSPA